jgi:hypothetical protein
MMMDDDVLLTASVHFALFTLAGEGCFVPQLSGAADATAAALGSDPRGSATAPQSSLLNSAQLRASRTRSRRR